MNFVIHLVFNLGKCGNEQARYLGEGEFALLCIYRPYNGVCVVHGRMGLVEACYSSFCCLDNAMECVVHG